MALRLIVGLGNPGPEYAGTRHNAGFQFLDRLAGKHGLKFTLLKFKAYLAEGEIRGCRVILAKPLTFMNLSGQAVKPLVKSYGIQLEDLLVVYDDMDLPLGSLRFRPQGGAGGHKGMRSVIEALGNRQFPRLRFGIGRPRRGDPVDYVLSEFTEDEKAAMERAYELGVRIVEAWIAGGVRAALDEQSRLFAGENAPAVNAPGEREGPSEGPAA